jgi:phosphoribosylformylglycinamidine cyclo-ligase
MGNIITYKDSGVDITAGNEAKDKIKKIVRKTYNKNVLSEIGLFGGLYRFEKNKYQKPVLVSSADGVGTKLKIACMMNKHDTIGEDLVNHCVNDILACGAQPLFFLDYLAFSQIPQTVIVEIIEGLARGCERNGCALIGGETAQMPGLYSENEYDVAGTIIGVVEQAQVINGSRIKTGDVLIGLYSTGLHTNGYSLARKVLLEHYKIDAFIKNLNTPLGECLLAVHKSYLKPVQAVVKKYRIKGISHITGGGIIENTLRVIPDHLRLYIDWASWRVPEIFQMIQTLGKVPTEDMTRTFNLGVGMILIVDKKDVRGVQAILKKSHESSFIIGEVVKKK